jgi:hypothetical protein
MNRRWTLAIAACTFIVGARAADTSSTVGKTENDVSSAASATGHAVGTAARKTGEVATEAGHGAEHGLQKGGAAMATQIDKADKAMHGKSGKSAVADVKAQSDPTTSKNSTAAAKAASQSK